jgi:superoxide dismutase
MKQNFPRFNNDFKEFLTQTKKGLRGRGWLVLVVIEVEKPSRPQFFSVSSQKYWTMTKGTNG